MVQKPVILPFGKYRGQPISILETDPDYCRWTPLNSEKFTSSIKNKIAGLTHEINNARPGCRDIEGASNFRADLEKCLKRYEGLNLTDIVTNVDFECDGWDVLIKAKLPQEFAMWLDGDWQSGTYYKISLGLEIKPVVGDDFPGTLRQVKDNARRYKPDLMAMVYKDFDASNLPEEKVKEFFNASGFAMFSFDQIEEVANRYKS